MNVKNLLLIQLAFATWAANGMAQQTGCKGSQIKSYLLGALAGKSATGQQWNIKDRPARVYFISFVQTVPDTEPTDSRTQSLSLSSMAHQYPSAISVLVDASVLKTNRIPDADELLNVWHDWSLRNVVLLSDPEGHIRHTFGICDVPETFLLRSDGTILEHWNSLVPTGILALSVERVLPDEAAALHASRVKKGPPLPGNQE
jgi:hypothetical protein